VIRDCLSIAFSTSYNRHICVDIKESDAILEFLEEHEDQFQIISDRILEQKFMYITPSFKQLSNYDNLCEMRFNVGGDNGRIYCHQIRNEKNEICIVMCRLLKKKKVTKWDKSIKDMAKSIEKYEYTVKY
jgi:hypothetical protein